MLPRIAALSLATTLLAGAPQEDWAKLKPGKALKEAVARQVQAVRSLEADLAELKKRADGGEASPDMVQALQAMIPRCTAAQQGLSDAVARLKGSSGSPEVAEAIQELDAAAEKASALSDGVLAVADQVANRLAPTQAELAQASVDQVAESVARALADQLAPLRSRRVLVAQVVYVESSVKPKVPALATTGPFDPLSAGGRDFSQVLQQQLTKHRFQASWGGDPAPFLGPTPPAVGTRPAKEFVLVHGAVSVQPHQHVAWHLRAVDLANAAEVAQSKGSVELGQPSGRQAPR